MPPDQTGEQVNADLLTQVAMLRASLREVSRHLEALLDSRKFPAKDFNRDVRDATDKWYEDRYKAIRTAHSLLADADRDKHTAGRRIVACALNAHGVIYSLPSPKRHHDIIRHLHETGVPPEVVLTAMQGFIDERNVFLDRREAFKVAQGAGQLLEPSLVGTALYSEDIW